MTIPRSLPCTLAALLAGACSAADPVTVSAGAGGLPEAVPATVPAEVAEKAEPCCDPAAEAAAEKAAELGESLDVSGAEPCCEPSKDTATGTTVAAAATDPDFTLPDVELVDQDGHTVHLPDLADGRLVVCNFVFTTCTTICPPLAANFARLQALLDEHGTQDVHLVSISVDALNDTPERMRAFGERFGARPETWTLLTGPKRVVDGVLKSLGVFTPDKEAHTPLVLVGDGVCGRGRFVDGFTAPERLLAVVDELRAARPATRPVEPEPAFVNAGARDWFTDVSLVDHDGVSRRFYSDLLQGKTVVIDSFFAECTGVCPVLAGNLTAIQEAFADRLGRDLVLLSISVDPGHDTPEVLGEYARTIGALPGWYFLTGDPGNVRQALGKLGMAVESREQHSNLLLIGNDRTGLWKKAMGLADSGEVVRIVKTVLDDDGA